MSGMRTRAFTRDTVVVVNNRRRVTFRAGDEVYGWFGKGADGEVCEIPKSLVKKLLAEGVLREVHG